MLKQIFRENPHPLLLFEILEKVCLKTDKYYLVDNNAYRKIIFHGYEKDFLESLLPYYQESKKFYISRKFTYNSFMNIIRQICKTNAIMFNSSIKYNESKYNIDYFVYFKSADLEYEVSKPI
jgi:hypothetical protein